MEHRPSNAEVPALAIPVTQFARNLNGLRHFASFLAPLLREHTLTALKTFAADMRAAFSDALQQQAQNDASLAEHIRKHGLLEKDDIGRLLAFNDLPKRAQDAITRALASLLTSFPGAATLASVGHEKRLWKTS